MVQAATLGLIWRLDEWGAGFFFFKQKTAYEI